MHRMVGIAAMLALATVHAGCAVNRSEQLPFASGSQSSLSRKNFRVMQSNVQGVSYGFALLGIVPILSPSGSEAMHDLHRQIPAEQGKAIALVNVVQDRSTTYAILFSIPKVTVSADAIEFLDEPGTATRPKQPDRTGAEAEFR